MDENLKVEKPGRQCSFYILTLSLLSECPLINLLPGYKRGKLPTLCKPINASNFILGNA